MHFSGTLEDYEGGDDGGEIVNGQWSMMNSLCTIGMYYVSMWQKAMMMNLPHSSGTNSCHSRNWLSQRY